MKKYAVVLGLAISFVACKNDKTTTEAQVEKEITAEVIKKEYPVNIAAIFDAHGGLEQWQKMNNICFAFEGRGGEEVHTTSLKDRREKIENENWTIGNDGKNTWLLENEEGSYKGNAAFYKNLMFYFYAMPFVIADDGIVYTDMPQRELDGTMYNAVKISYNSGVGYSSSDEYMLFSDIKTNTMAWLGYTVTGTSNKKSDKWSFIKYSNWQKINGLMLPETLSWYKVEDNQPTEKRNDRVFSKVTMTETQLADSVFAMPEGAKAVE